MIHVVECSPHIRWRAGVRSERRGMVRSFLALELVVLRESK